jgi:hypothetical protein
VVVAARTRELRLEPGRLAPARQELGDAVASRQLVDRLDRDLQLRVAAAETEAEERRAQE